MSAEKPLIAITQRVDLLPARNERRDALDQRWYGFLEACGYLAVPLPNHAATAAALIARFKPAGILLSGGNDPVLLGGDAPERDEMELKAIAWARDNHVPVLGICRGMQMIAHAHGGNIQRVPGHAGTPHNVGWNGKHRQVNSYHTIGVVAAPAGFDVLARSDDQTVEAMRRPADRIAGLMWHPEREEPYDPRDIAFVRGVFEDAS